MALTEVQSVIIIVVAGIAIYAVIQIVVLAAAGKFSSTDDETTDDKTAGRQAPNVVPADVTATSVHENTVTVAWSEEVPNATGYVVTYFVDGEAVNTTDVHVDGGSVLSHTITQLRGNTRYWFTVMAVNVLGNGPASEAVNVTSLPVLPPLAPTGVTADNVVPEQLIVSWNTAGSITATTYQLSYHAVGSNDFETVDAGRNTLFTLQNLVPREEYNITVRGVNVLGPGANSIPVNVTVREASVPLAVTGLTATSPNAYSATVSWSPNPSHEYVTGYTAQYKVQGTLTYTSVSLDKDTTSVDLSNLDANVEYTVRVSATNDFGEGDPSTTVDVTIVPTTVPVAPTGLAVVSTSPFVLSATWDDLASTEGVTSYTFEFKRSSDLTYTPMVTLSPSIDVSGLEGATDYDCRVTGVNTLGDGTPSVVVTVMISPTVPPLAPTNLTVDDSVENHLTLHWTKVNADSAATEYRIEWFHSPQSMTVNVPASASTYMITGLLPGTVYDVAVSALNAAGHGPKAKSAGHVRPYAPDTPTNLSIVVSPIANTVHYSFTGVPLVDAYTVRYRVKGTSTAWISENVAMLSSGTITVVGGSELEFHVVAHNSTLESIPSDDVYAHVYTSDTGVSIADGSLVNTGTLGSAFDATVIGTSTNVKPETRNGHACWEFGGDAGLTLATSTAVGQDWTMAMCVFTQDELVVSDNSTIQGTRQVLYSDSTNTIAFDGAGNSNKLMFNNLNTTGTPQASGRSYVVIVSGSSTGTFVVETTRADGNSSDIASITTAIDLTPLHLGFDAVTSQNSLIGKFFEYRLFTGVLTVDEKAMLTTTLLDKWAVQNAPAVPELHNVVGGVLGATYSYDYDGDSNVSDARIDAQWSTDSGTTWYGQNTNVYGTVANGTTTLTLDPGSYTFRLSAFNHLGRTWSTNEELVVVTDVATVSDRPVEYNDKGLADTFVGITNTGSLSDFDLDGTLGTETNITSMYRNGRLSYNNIGTAGLTGTAISGSADVIALPYVMVAVVTPGPNSLATRKSLVKELPMVAVESAQIVVKPTAISTERVLPTTMITSAPTTHVVIMTCSETEVYVRCVSEDGTVDDNMTDTWTADTAKPDTYATTAGLSTDSFVGDVHELYIGSGTLDSTAEQATIDHMLAKWGQASNSRYTTSP
jgi:hypothetical protein